ncbi:MAG: glycerol-3-phosphate dehydrogenase C-terminal domain-containing protein, partial [Saprospiraceae bacterium]|nr:glycerol-3-phosphate dehydrogenase C-terminal domain-containing protein [Saprospiraceae bacterium]
KNFGNCKTDTIPLYGGPFNNEKEVKEYQVAIAQSLAAIGLDEYYAIYLVANYGRQVDTILEFIEDFKDQPEIALARAELKFSLENELIFKALDFFNRRTGRLYFHINSIEPALNAVLADIKKYFNWTDERVSQEKLEVQNAIREASNFG